MVFGGGSVTPNKLLKITLHQKEFPTQLIETLLEQLVPEVKKKFSLPISELSPSLQCADVQLER